MATLVKKRLGKNFSFSLKMAFFLLQNVFISNFLAQIRNQRLRNDPCAKFQLHWKKDKRTQIFTWNDTKNGLMTSTYLLVMTSAKFLWLLRDFVSEYHHAKFGCNWTANKRKPTWFQKTPA